MSLWSLSCEFWFYVTFAAAACAVFALAGRRFVGALVNGLVLVAATVLFGIHLFVLIPSWLLGVAVAEAASRQWLAASVQRHRGRYLSLAVIAVGGGMLVTNLLQPSRPVLMLIIGIPAAALTLVAVQVRGSLNRNRLVGLTAGLGDWSYSLYVFHAPILVLLVGVAQQHGLIGGWRLVAAVYAAAAIALVASWCVSRVTERHTPMVRRVMFDALTFAVARRRRHPEPVPQPAESA